MHPSITIITPSYNQGSYIERTIHSVLAQNINGLEYWVIDGNSQDETQHLLQKYRDQLKSISEPDRGQAHAVNKGLALAQGKIIGWLNSDDIYYPNALKTVLDFFEAHPDIDVVYGQALHIDTQDQFINAYPTEPWNPNHLKHYCYLAQPAVFFRRTILEKYGYLDEDLHYCLDYEFWLRLALKGARFAYLEQVLAATRLYPQTKTLSDPLKPREEALIMLQRHFTHIPSCWFLNYAYTKCKKHKNTWANKLLLPFQVYKQALSKAYHHAGITRAILLALSLPWVAGQMWHWQKHKIQRQKRIAASNASLIAIHGSQTLYNRISSPTDPAQRV